MNHETNQLRTARDRFTLLLAAFLGLGLFSQAVHNNSHNEQMYVTVYYLLAGERLYTDFAFVQTPYSPLIYAVVFKLTGGYYLFSAKLVNSPSSCLCRGAVLALARRRTRRPLQRRAKLSSSWRTTTRRAAIEASNYTIPIAFSLAAYALFLRYIDRAVRSPLRRRRAAGRAVGPSSTTQPCWRPSPWLRCSIPSRKPAQPHHRRAAAAGRRNRCRRASCSTTPRDWERFAFNNLGYHLLNTRPGASRAVSPP